MLLIWGTRTYGAVEKVGSVSVQTTFGHLWYLPFIPKDSYYVDSQDDTAIKLRHLHLRSVLTGYTRGWSVFFALVLLLNAVFPGKGDEDDMTRFILLALPVLAFAASYVFDKKIIHPNVPVRYLMASHFGSAVDPYLCNANFCEAFARQVSKELDHDPESGWYKKTLNDGFADRRSKELSILRARCDQHDQDLQRAIL